MAIYTFILVQCLCCFIYCHTALAETVILGTNEHPPYATRDTYSGLEVEIIRQALAYSNHNIELVFYPTGRSELELKNKRIDLMAPSFSATEEFYLSDSHIDYHIGLFSNSDKNLQINSVNDLNRYSIATFYGAKNFLGQQFSKVVGKSPLYIELGDARRVVSLLFMQRIDLVILELNTFQYYKHQDNSYKFPLKNHKLFSSFPASVAFHNKSLKDEFNFGLTQLKKSGQYTSILKHYASMAKNPSITQ